MGIFIPLRPMCSTRCPLAFVWVFPQSLRPLMHFTQVLGLSFLKLTFCMRLEMLPSLFMSSCPLACAMEPFLGVYPPCICCWLTTCCRSTPASLFLSYSSWRFLVCLVAHFDGSCHCSEGTGGVGVIVRKILHENTTFNAKAICEVLFRSWGSKIAIFKYEKNRKSQLFMNIITNSIFPELRLENRHFNNNPFS